MLLILCVRVHCHAHDANDADDADDADGAAGGADDDDDAGAAAAAAVADDAAADDDDDGCYIGMKVCFRSGRHGMLGWQCVSYRLCLNLTPRYVHGDDDESA